MGKTKDTRIKQEIRLKKDWYGLRLNAFPQTEEELLIQATYFKAGTIFIEYSNDLPAPDEDPDCIENEGPYGWMYRDGDTLKFAHFFSPTLDSWRSWREMFEEINNG